MTPNGAIPYGGSRSPPLQLVKSLASAEGAFAITLLMPFRRVALLAYIWLDPITSPVLAPRDK